MGWILHSLDVLNNEWERISTKEHKEVMTLYGLLLIMNLAIRFIPTKTTLTTH